MLAASRGPATAAVRWNEGAPPLGQARSWSGSSASVGEFHRHEAGNRDGDEELPEDRLKIGQAAGKRIDRNNVAVAGGCQCREAEIQHAPDFFRTPFRRDEIGEGTRAQFPD